jgi:hypothetical protein
VVTTRSQALLALGLTPNATHQDTIRAFRKLSLRHHPDRAGEHDEFITILSAKDVLLEGPGNGESLSESSPVGDASEWTVPGARARVPVPRTSTNQTRYYAPFLDSLFGPSPFERCKESIGRGSVSYTCACKKCEQADLYAPLGYEEYLQSPGSSPQNDSPSEDAPSLHHGEGNVSSACPSEGSLADHHSDDGFDCSSSVIVISDDEDDSSRLRLPDAVDSRCAHSENGFAKPVIARETTNSTGSESADKFSSQLETLSFVDGHNVSRLNSVSRQNTGNQTTQAFVSQTTNEVDKTTTFNISHKHGGHNRRRNNEERNKARRRRRNNKSRKSSTDVLETPPNNGH